MNIIKSYIKKKTVNYYRSYYYRNSFTAFDFKERYVFCNNKKVILTQTPIIFKGKIEFGLNEKEIQQILGKSHFIYQDERLEGYITLYYKNKISNLKNKSQLHLYKNHFFYGIQVFPYINKQQIQDIVSLLQVKYQFSTSFEMPFILKDANNNKLIVSENVGLSMEYITGNEFIINQVLIAYKNWENNCLSKEKQKTQYLLSQL